MFGSDLVSALVAATVSQANLGYMLGDTELARRWGAVAPPGQLRRPISAYAVAAALRLPRETVRRKIKALVAINFIEETPEGFVLQAPRTDDASGSQMLSKIFDLTAEFCADLHQAGLVAPSARVGESVGAPRVRMVALATTAFMLRFFEDLDGVAEDQMTGLTYLAITLANTRYIDWRGDPTPFHSLEASTLQRRPITALALATDVGLARETARRQVRKLLSRGYVQLSAGGLVANPGALPRPAVDRFVVRTEANVRRLLSDLRVTGIVQAR